MAYDATPEGLKKGHPRSEAEKREASYDAWTKGLPRAGCIPGIPSASTLETRTLYPFLFILPFEEGVTDGDAP